MVARCWRGVFLVSPDLLNLPQPPHVWPSPADFCSGVGVLSPQRVDLPAIPSAYSRLAFKLLHVEFMVRRKTLPASEFAFKLQQDALGTSSLQQGSGLSLLSEGHVGFRGFGLRHLGFRSLGCRGLGFRGLGFRGFP